MAEPQLDHIIEKLVINGKNQTFTTELSEQELTFLCDTVCQLFQQEENVLELKPPLIIVGDVHGQFYDLSRIFEKGGYPPDQNYLFLGDYVDRGPQSIETISLLFAFKIKYPNQVFLLRGNHECIYINRMYGFYDEVIHRFSPAIWRKFCDVFNYLPISAVIDQKIFCIHGGISPQLNTPQDILQLERPMEVPEEGLLCDLLWSDPNPEANAEDWESSDRGTSYIYSVRPVEEFLNRNNFDLICRAHQAVMDGFEFSFTDNQSLLTLFSAPNYCNEYMNKGAILQVAENLYCTFQVLDPIACAYPDPDIVRPGTPPRESIDSDQPIDFNL